MSKNTTYKATQEALDDGYGQTKYGVLEGRGEDYSTEALQGKTASVRCPTCQEALCPAEQHDGNKKCRSA